MMIKNFKAYFAVVAFIIAVAVMTTNFTEAVAGAKENTHVGKGKQQKEQTDRLTQVMLLRDEATALEKKGDIDTAFYTRGSADMLEANDGTEQGAARAKAIGLRMHAAIFRREAAKLTAQGKSTEAHEKKQMADAYDASADTSPEGEERAVRLYQEMAIASFRKRSVEHDVKGRAKEAAIDRLQADHLEMLNQHAETAKRNGEDILEQEVNKLKPQAVKLEKTGRWAEAEKIWRRLRKYPGIDDKLANNLAKQGKHAQAAEIFEKIHDDKVNAAEGRGGQQSELYINLIKNQGAVAAAEGDNARAESMKRYVEAMELAKDKSAAGKARAAKAWAEFGASNAQIFAKDAAGNGNEKLAETVRQMGRVLEAEANTPTPTGWQGMTATEQVKDRVNLALKQIKGGLFEQAEKNLLIACPLLRDQPLVDVPAATIVFPNFNTDADGVKIKGVSPQECFAELTLVRVQKNPDAKVDAQAFSAVQNATRTDAGFALSQSAARKFVERNGGGKILEQIDANVREGFKDGERFWRQFDISNLEKELGENENILESDLIKKMLEIEPKGKAQSIAIDRLVNELKSKVPTYFDLRAPEPVSLEALQVGSKGLLPLLHSDEAVVLWMNVPGRRHGLVFAISRARAAWAKMTLTGDEIAERVERLRNQIDPCLAKKSKGNCQFAKLSFDLSAAWDLHQTLLGQKSIQDVIGADAVKTLMIVPSGPLTALPPALLLTAPPRADKAYNDSTEGWANSAWLLKKKMISILPSISALRTLRVTLPRMVSSSAASGRGDRLFMLADPDFSGQGSPPTGCVAGARATPKAIQTYFQSPEARRIALGKLPALPCTRLEGESLRTALGGIVLFGRDARESQLKTLNYRKKLADAEVIVFATHGIVSGEIGLGEPALALAAPLAGEKEDDGLLTASEVTELKLSADWVVLSACNTASPDINDAEGLSGLSRAFFYAGAKSVLASHWRVNDATTKELMVQTITRRPGISKAQALRDASLALLEKDDNKYAHPAFWAPFTLIGEPR